MGESVLLLMKRSRLTSRDSGIEELQVAIGVGTFEQDVVVVDSGSLDIVDGLEKLGELASMLDVDDRIGAPMGD